MVAYSTRTCAWSVAVDGTTALHGTRRSTHLAEGPGLGSDDAPSGPHVRAYVVDGANLLDRGRAVVFAVLAGSLRDEGPVIDRDEHDGAVIDRALLDLGLVLVRVGVTSLGDGTVVYGVELLEEGAVVDRVGLGVVLGLVSVSVASGRKRAVVHRGDLVLVRVAPDVEDRTIVDRGRLEETVIHGLGLGRSGVVGRVGDVVEERAIIDGVGLLDGGASEGAAARRRGGEGHGEGDLGQEDEPKEVGPGRSRGEEVGAHAAG